MVLEKMRQLFHGIEFLAAYRTIKNHKKATLNGN